MRLVGRSEHSVVETAHGTNAFVGELCIRPPFGPFRLSPLSHSVSVCLPLIARYVRTFDR